MYKFISKKKRALLTAALCCALLPANAYAAADKAGVVDDSAVTVTNQAVVVTASRTKQEVKETPAAVEVITHEELERTGANTLTQALKMTTDINVTQSAMGNNVSIRGMNNNQTLILVNGRRVRTEDTNDSANKYELNRVNMSDVDHVEIVRGSASSLYGSDAMGGVINIITKKSSAPEVTAGTDWTSHEKDSYFHVGSGKQGKWSFDIDAKYSDTKNWGYLGSTDQVINMGTGTYSMLTNTTNQYGKRYFLNFDGRYDLSKDKELDVFLDYMKEDLESQSFTSHILSMPAYSGTVLTAGYRNLFNHERWTTGIGYKGKDHLGDYEMRVYHTRFNKKQDVYYSSYSGKNHVAGDLSSTDDMTFNSTTLDGKRSLQLGGGNLMTVGGEYRSEHYDSTRLTEDSDMKYSALYAQDEWQINPKWLVIPSVRWDYSDIFGSKVTSKLGSTYHLSKNTRLKTNIGTAYRAPTASELYMDWSHSSYAYILGNSNLRPETAVNFDIALEAEQGRTSGKVSYFHNKVKDMIDYEYQGVTSGLYTYKYYNVDNATIQGVETEAKQKLGDKFALRTTYTYLDAVNSDTGERLANRARNSIKLMLEFDDEKNSGITATLWQDWLLDYRYELGEDVGTTDFNTLNFVVNKKFNDNLNAYVGVDNIADQKNTNLFADGRVWRVGMKYSF